MTERDGKPTLPPMSDAGIEPQPADAPRIEGYQISGKLGEGGMGTVWRAVQLSTHRPVALKLLSPAMFGSDKARARFEREVELTAQLEHPCIGRVYDSGVHQGVYCFAMELIEGMRLDEYVAQRQLPARQILELMATVCDAIQHAHQRGVIHTDLKPSNIMVSADSQPHVLDFGLAKSYWASAGDRDLSISGLLAGTPVFMSPEQAAGRRMQLDTRTDVYTLGVILYVLLTGQYPHEPSEQVDETLRRIREEEPRRPRVVQPAMDRELETLLLKALAQEPDQRYGSAADLAEDIRNYLNGEPLMARPPSTIYFLRKRLRKHWVPVSATAAVLLVLAATLAVSYVRVTHERNKAVKARQQAESVLEFLVYDMRDDLKKVGRLDLAAKVQHRVNEYHRQLGTDMSLPDTLRNQAISLDTDGDLAFSKGDLAGALACYQRSLAVTEQLIRASPTNTQWQRDLGVGYNNLGNVQMDQGNLAGALANYRQSLAIREKLARLDPSNTVWQRALFISHSKLGDVQQLQGNLAAALDSYRQALAISETLARPCPGNADRQYDLAVCYTQVGDVQMAQNDFDGALASCRQSLAIRQRLIQQDPNNAEWQSGLGVGYNKLGNVQGAQGDLAGALASYRQVLAITGRLAQQDPANAQWQRNLSVAHDKLGRILAGQGDLAGALTHYQQAAVIAGKLARQDPGNARWQRDLSVCYERLGEVLATQGDRPGALASYRQSLAIGEKLAQQDPANTERQADLVEVLVRISWACDTRQPAGRDEARAALERALAIAERLQQDGKLTSHLQKGWVWTLRWQLKQLR